MVEVILIQYIVNCESLAQGKQDQQSFLQNITKKAALKLELVYVILL